MSLLWPALHSHVGQALSHYSWNRKGAFPPFFPSHRDILTQKVMNFSVQTASYLCLKPLPLLWPWWKWNQLFGGGAGRKVRDRVARVRLGHMTSAPWRRRQSRPSLPTRIPEDPPRWATCGHWAEGSPFRSCSPPALGGAASVREDTWASLQPRVTEGYGCPFSEYKNGWDMDPQEEVFRCPQPGCWVL